MKENIWGYIKQVWQHKKSFSFSVITLVTGTTIAQTITVASVPLITRLYTPEDFGIFTVYLSIIALLAPLMSGRYELAIPIASAIENALELIVLCLVLILWMTLLSSLGVWLLSDFIIMRTNTPGLRPFLWLIPFCLFGMGLYQVFYNLALREKFFSAIARTKFIQSLGQALLQVGIGCFNLGILGLIAGDIFGKTAGSASLAWRNRLNIKGRLQKITLVGIKSVAGQYKYFPIFTSSSTLLNTAGLQVPNFFLAASFGPEVVGWFALSQRLLGLPLTLVGLSLAQVFYTEVAQRLREQPAMVKPLFFKTMRYSLLMTAPIVLLALGSPWLFAIFFGENWAEAGKYTIYLIPMYIFQFVISTNNLLLVAGFNHWQFCWDTARLISIIIIFMFAQKFHWSPASVIISYSLAMVLLYSVLFGLNKHVLKSFEKA